MLTLQGFFVFIRAVQNLIGHNHGVIVVCPVSLFTLADRHDYARLFTVRLYARHQCFSRLISMLDLLCQNAGWVSWSFWIWQDHLF